MSDLNSLKERFEGLKEAIMVFIDQYRLPSVQTELISFLQRCDKFEAKIIAMKTEMGMTHAEVNRDHSNEYLEVYRREVENRLNSVSKWEIEIIVDKDSALADLQMSLGELKAMIGAMDDFKWLLKARRDSASQHFEFLSGS
jgi:hypothetical protein